MTQHAEAKDGGCAAPAVTCPGQAASRNVSSSIENYGYSRFGSFDGICYHFKLLLLIVVCTSIRFVLFVSAAACIFDIS